ncbi:MAG TPA: transglycosylase SLT domain-containing protein [Kofleriaceae bacterium]|nr:transglycosylase SLT domain-containing protein [Kofleriaceae bacterium]
MSFIALVLRHLELALRLHAAVPWLPPDVAYAHAEAAEAAATDQVPPELLLGIAFVESRFDPTAVSRVEGHTRRTGAYPSSAAPAQLDRRASLYCGPLQTYAPSWSACVTMRRLEAGYAAGAAELRQWLGDRRVRGSTARALAGHGCGNFGVVSGQCRGYPERVLDMTRRLRPQRAEAPTRAVASS